MRVERGFAQGGERVAEGFALFRREGALAGAALAPTGGEREVVARHVAAVHGGGDGDGGGLRAQRALRDAGDQSFGVEQGREFTAARGPDPQPKM